jgi:hypothetical protein
MPDRSSKLRPSFVIAGIFAAAFLGLCLYGIVTRYIIKPKSHQATFHLKQGQQIYIIARDDWTDNWTDEFDDDELREHITADRRAERMAGEEFLKNGKVTITKNEREAAFTFLVVIDPRATKKSIYAELAPTECYKDSEASLSHCDSRWMTWGDSPTQVVQQFCKEVVP